MLPIAAADRAPTCLLGLRVSQGPLFRPFAAIYNLVHRDARKDRCDRMCALVGHACQNQLSINCLGVA